MSFLAALLLAFGPALPADAARSCTLPEGWQAVDARKPRFVIFGETHGSVESPAFVGEVACGLLAGGKRILLGIEFDAHLNDKLRAAWRLPDAAFREQLPTIGWAGRADGVASRAMFDLLLRLHALKAKGAAIDIVAFNGARDRAQQLRFETLPGQGPHEAAQAENIADAAKAAPYDLVLVLVGGFHARQLPVGQGPDRFEPMALRLAPAGRVVSLQLRQAGGTIWGCQLKPGLQLGPGDAIPADAIECIEHAIKGEDDLHRAPFLHLGTEADSTRTGYDGFFWVGALHASPPLIPQAPAGQSPHK